MQSESPTPSRRGVAVVSGGAGGLGSGICRALCESGMHVVILDLAAEGATDTAAQLSRDGYSASGRQCDVTSPTDVATVQSAITAEVGKVEVLVNLAGVVRNAVLGKISESDFDLTLKTHAAGTLLTMQAFGGAMKTQGYGRIINTSSVASLGTVGGISYSAAKGAIEAMSRSVAIELAPFGVTVNCVAPGVIDAGMFLTTPKSFQETVLTRTPMRRAGRVEEVAACVRFLSSKEASFITGQTIFVCGGASIGAF